MFMFMLISDDENSDLKEMLKEMKEENMKKQALREKISKLKENICHFIDQRGKAN